MSGPKQQFTVGSVTYTFEPDRHDVGFLTRLGGSLEPSIGMPLARELVQLRNPLANGQAANFILPNRSKTLTTSAISNLREV